jgi:two-component sensor histidine kinase/DNA-binding NarL/FixJ family response regulator
VIPVISVLYVDDEPDLLEIGRLYLERKKAFRVDTARSVGEAKEKLAAERFDVIVSDYQMPESDGIEFLKFVRVQYRNVPFILFTGKGREEVVIAAINHGADFYLQKGGNPEAQFAELGQKIRIAAEKHLAEEALWKQTFVLEERVKELACLYRLAEIISAQGLSIEEMLKQALDVIPAGYQYPESTNARITFRGKEFATQGFRRSIWNQNFPLFTDGEWAGAVEVSYTGEWADPGNAPFLSEESSLLHGIVRLLENSLTCKIIDERLRDTCGIGSPAVPANADPAQKSERDLRLAAERNLKRSQELQEQLLREVQQRVKDNLHTVHDLLSLQSRYIRDEKITKALSESQNRIRAMALVHEILYQSPELSKIDLAHYVKILGDNLLEFYGGAKKSITLRIDIQNVFLGIDAAIPLGLVFNELMSNSLKHAFPERNTGEIAITVKKEGQTLSVIFADNGIGIPRDLNWRDPRSLGLRMVFALVKQMNGTIGLDRSAGTAFTMVLEDRA